MALSDFLGETAEIKIIDFLAENSDRRYSVTELSDCVGLSRTTIYEKLPKLIYNKIVKVAGKTGRSTLVQTEDNAIVDGLTQAVISNSFLVAGEKLEEEEAYEQIKADIGAFSTGSIKDPTISQCNSMTFLLELPAGGIYAEPSFNLKVMDTYCIVGTGMFYMNSQADRNSWSASHSLISEPMREAPFNDSRKIITLTSRNMY